MQFRQLEMLVAVVEEGGIGRAANRLFVTQPAVSGGLRKLTEEVGTPIFSSCSRGGTKLTAAGNSLYDYARKLLALRDEALRAIESEAAAEHTRVRVGADEISSIYLLPELVERFHRFYPRTRIQTVSAGAEELIRLLKEEKADVVISSRRPEEPGLVTHSLYSDELVLIVAPHHPLANRRKVTVQDLAEESLILEANATSARNNVIEAFQAASLNLNVAFETANLEMTKKLVSLSLGVAIVPRVSVQAEAAEERVVTRSVEGLCSGYQVWAARLNVPSQRASVQNFLDHLRNMTGKKRRENAPLVAIPGDPGDKAMTKLN